MKAFILPLCLAAGLLAKDPVPVSPELQAVKTVYLLGMSNGLDQYLANHLTNHQIFVVTTDPAKADAVVTDNLGARFQEKLTELYPPPPEPKPAPVAKDDKEKKDADKDKDKDSDLKTEKMVRFGNSTWGRGKGNIYIVDRKSKAVIWSTYHKPKNFTAPEMNRTASKVATELRKGLKGS